MRGRARFLLGPDVQFPVTDRWQLNILYEDPEYELLSRQRAAHELEASK